jgi:hypothetical protein
VYTTPEIDNSKAAINARIDQLEAQLNKRITDDEHVTADIRDIILKRIDALPLELATNEKAYNALKERLKKDIASAFDAAKRSAVPTGGKNAK